jgi:hypothetical protein
MLFKSGNAEWLETKETLRSSIMDITFMKLKSKEKVSKKRIAQFAEMRDRVYSEKHK